MTRETVGKTVSDTARAAGEAGRKALKEAGAEIGAAAQRGKEIAAEEVAARAEGGKEMLSEQGQKLADRIRAQAGDDDFPLRGRLLDIVADGVSGLSEDLRHQSFSSIIEQTEAFARRNPGAFVAGAAVAGFALARFARASGRREESGGRDALPALSDNAEWHSKGEAHPAENDSGGGSGEQPG